MAEANRARAGEDSMRIFAIDPGNTQSAFAVYDAKTMAIIQKGKLPNMDLFEEIECAPNVGTEFSIEMIASYGMAVGKDVFETCLWIGRFYDRIEQVHGKTPALVYRTDVKMHLCGTRRAKDANIRQAIIDIYPPIGGGKTPQIGTKAAPGPLYGVSADVWAAIGVAMTRESQIKTEEARVV